MKADLDHLKLDTLVIHHIRRWDDSFGNDLPKPVLAKKPSKLGVEEKKFLEEKVGEAARDATIAAIRPSAAAVADGNENPARLLKLIKSDSELVSLSQLMVGDLVESQGRVGGADYLVAIGTGKCKGRSVVILFTMHIEQGMRAILDKADSPPELEQIKDLVLDGKAHLNKMVALEDDEGKAVGIVEDSLVGNSDAARYFLSKFLGYETTDSARKQTQDFYRVVSKVINTHITKPEDKLALSHALQAEVNNESHIIDISAFRKKHVPAEYHPAFDGEIEHRKLPKGKIGRDSTLIEKQAKRRTMRLTNGIEVRLPSGVSEDSIEHGRDSKGDFVKIRGKLERFE